jgi:transposase
MRNGISITVSRPDRRRLQALVADRNASQKHVWRAEIVLLTADGLGTNEIMRRTAKSKTCVWRWQERFMEEGFDGLLRDKTRPSRIEPLKADVAERVVAMTLTDPPGETTHWTAGSTGRFIWTKRAMPAGRPHLPHVAPRGARSGRGADPHAARSESEIAAIKAGGRDAVR